MDVSTAWQAICDTNLPRGANVAGGDFDRPNFQGFFVDPYVYLAPDAAFQASRCPAAHALHVRKGACGRSIRLRIPT